jgi:fatty-acyl-CoA synthase
VPNVLRAKGAHLLTPAAQKKPDALADYAREPLARYKVPKRIEFGDLPKTSTRKIQKNVLRDAARERDGAL